MFSFTGTGLSSPEEREAARARLFPKHTGSASASFSSSRQPTQRLSTSPPRSLPPTSPLAAAAVLPKAIAIKVYENAASGKNVRSKFGMLRSEPWAVVKIYPDQTWEAAEAALCRKWRQTYPTPILHQDPPLVVRHAIVGDVIESLDDLEHGLEVRLVFRRE